jgi:predicted TIM-barrel fold metal-dependent hydrolase
VIDFASVNRIDCHMHYMPNGFDNRAQTSGASGSRRPLGSPDSDGRPGWTDLGELRAVMDGAGVDLGVLLTFPHHATPFRKDGESIPEAIGRYNQAMSADLDAQGQDRFVMTASVDPLSGLEGIEQLRKDLELPHVRGIALLTNYGDVTLDDPRFEPIFSLARDHNVAVTVHPGSAWPSWRDGARLGESSFLSSGLGYFLADALCIFHMAHAGVFERFPTVRFMFCQLGGAAAICCGRWHFHRTQALEQAAQLHIPVPQWARCSLNEVLSQVWLDTHTQDRHAIRFVLAEAGFQSVVLGGDYPVSSVELGMHYMTAELDALRLDSDARRRIERDNALALLGLKGH